ncbi:MAG: hypothetical protein ABL949_04470 [Fimbriimonadaceae bacterium]
MDNVHPIRDLFADALHETLSERLGLNDEQIETYLTELLVKFIHQDHLFPIRDVFGRRVQSVPEMLAEGDVRLNANSFHREREVHKHVGDFMLFWGGMFPENLEQQGGFRAILECEKQGQESYQIASSFDHTPFDLEAPLLSKLANDFPAYRYGLNIVRDTLHKRAA